MLAEGSLLELHNSQIKPGKRPEGETKIALLSFSLFNTYNLGVKHQTEGRLSELNYITIKISRQKK